MQVLTPRSPLARVGFVVPRWNISPEPHLQGIPFRCLPVVGALYRAGYEVVFCDQEPDLDREPGEDRLRERLGGCRAIFFWNQDLDPLGQVPNLIAWSRRVRAWQPRTTIVAGGGFLALLPLEALTFDGTVDYYLRGYGETACPDLMAALLGRARLGAVNGLVWSDRGVHANPVAAVEPFRPENWIVYRLVDLHRYRQRGGIFGNGYATFTLGTGQGCAKRCGFCYWRNHKPSLAPVEAIVDLVSYLRQRYGVRQYHLGELDGFASKRRVLTLARLWRERVPDCIWFALASPSDAARLTDAEWDLLAAGGCRKIEFGSESGSADQLRALGKRHDAHAPIRLTRACLARGIVPMHNFVFGLVGETARDRRLTLDLIRRVRALDPARVCLTFRLYQPCWDTPMGEAAIARTPGFPRTLSEIVAFRHTAGGGATIRTMPWLGRRAERQVKRLVDYHLPLSTSRIVVSGRARRWVYRGLRMASGARVRGRFFAGGLDRWLYDRLVGIPLDSTFACGVA